MCIRDSSEAIRAGYRHIDTASAYHTEEAVGRAVAASGVDRSEFFITTKAWKDQLGYDRTLAAFDASCQALGMDYLDLYLILSLIHIFSGRQQDRHRH